MQNHLGIYLLPSSGGPRLFAPPYRGERPAWITSGRPLGAAGDDDIPWMWIGVTAVAIGGLWYFMSRRS